MNDQVENAIKILNQGGIVIFPTDTAFGIGCRIDSVASIKKLFKIRKRPLSQATPVLINSIETGKKYADISKEVTEKLIKPFWPGALTIIFNSRKENVPLLVRGGGDTVGLRMPNHETILEIINSVGVPILGPSANFHGEDTPYEFKNLNKELIKLVDFVVKGKCYLKMPSTIVDCVTTPWKILRKGAININI